MGIQSYNRFGARGSGKLKSLLIANLRLGEGREYVIQKAKQGDKQALADVDALTVPVPSLVWEAYHILHSTRGSDFGTPAGLLITEVIATLKLLRVHEEYEIRYVKYIMAMDLEHRKWISDNGDSES